MKKLLFFILLLPLFALAAGPANHYVDAVSGNDANAGTIGSPWKTITRVNTSFNVFLPGDSVLFKRGQTFYGSIIANRSGTARSTYCNRRIRHRSKTDHQRVYCGNGLDIRRQRSISQ